VRFYEELERAWTKVREFDPAGATGPRITVYKNPRITTPFAQRQHPAGGRLPQIARDLLPGSAAGYYERLGFVYEAYGFDRAASDVYRHGLLQREQPFEMRKSLVNGALRCLLRGGYGTDALALLDEVERAPTSPTEATYVKQLRQQITAGR
jgi:hypothetical protein